jgi:enoyl-[acyl-carrier protein] reductase II
LFGIEFPIIQAGMVWNSGWRLASAVSKAGGLGLIGAGSMYPEVLEEHIIKYRKSTDRPFGVNVPMLYPDIDKIMNILVDHEVDIVFTSAGNPATWTPFLKEHGKTVVHVVSSVRFAKKAKEAGVDAIVAEGFEAGGHNGREESTTFTLIPMVREHIDLPLIAAGGIANGKGMLAAMVLGADGVQIGSRFAASEESSSHRNFKEEIVRTEDGGTHLTLKELAPVRLIKNKFYRDLEELYRRGAGVEELKAKLGRARAKLGMFEGDLDEGELEIGQVAGLIHEIKPAGLIVKEIMKEYKDTRKKFCL